MVERYAPSGLVVIISGAILIALDFCWLMSWASMAALDIGRATGKLDVNDGLLRANTGFIALAAPHITLIPAIFAIISDVARACKNKGVCMLGEYPPPQWFLFCFLVIPFDVLEYLYNIQLKDKVFSQSTELKKNNYYVTLATFQLGNSSAICLWAACTWLWFVFSKPPQATEQAVGAGRGGAYYRLRA